MKLRKSLFVIGLTLAYSVTGFAQKGLAKDAYRAMEDKKYDEAKSLIQEAIKNPELAADQKTWKVAGDIENEIFTDQQKLQILGKKANDQVMYTALLQMLPFYIKADSLGEIPNEKGKIKNKVRKDIASILKTAHPNYINGGVYYNDKKDFKMAGQFFEDYWKIPNLPMFKDKDTFVKDSTYQIIKYYAIVSFYQAKDAPKTISLIKKALEEPFIPNKTYTIEDLYKYLASEYSIIKDSANFQVTIEEGAKKFPKSNYFISNLINVYLQKGKYDEAMKYLDTAEKNDPSNICDFASVKAGIYLDGADALPFDKMKVKAEQSEKEYQRALAADPKCNKALEGLGIVNILFAQKVNELTLSMKSKKEILESNKKTVAYYEKAASYLEKYVKNLKEAGAEQREIRKGLVKLQNAYYNLSMLGVDKSVLLKEVKKELEDK